MHMLFLARHIVIFLLFGKIRNFRMHRLPFPDFTASITWVFNVLAKCWWRWNAAAKIVTHRNRNEARLRSSYLFLWSSDFCEGIWFNKISWRGFAHCLWKILGFIFIPTQLLYQIKYGGIQNRSQIREPVF